MATIATPRGGFQQARRPSRAAKHHPFRDSNHRRPLPVRARRSSSGTSAGIRRRVTVSDQQLVSLAHKTASLVRWDRILDLQHHPDRVPWRWRETVGDFAIFSNGCALLAVGDLPATMAELHQVMHSTTSGDWLRKLEAMEGPQLQSGSYVHDVDLSNEALLAATSHEQRREETDLVHLSVKTHTYRKAKWFATPEKWHYLEAVHRHKSGHAYEKLLTTLPPECVRDGPGTTRTKALRHIIAGYLIHPQPHAPVSDPQQPARGHHPQQQHHGQEDAPISRPRGPRTRVHFYAEELLPPEGSSSSPAALTASPRAVRARMRAMAHNCDRAMQIIRRRRLGAQVLVDANRIRLPSGSSALCSNCHKLVGSPKLCRLCGLGVCDRCSTKHDRERPAMPGSSCGIDVLVESVRICGDCLDRVDAADY